MNEVKATDYPEVYENLGIDTGNMGCIMLDVGAIVVSDLIKDDDYYYSEEKSYVNGNVSEDVPHCTLLYGLLRPGPDMKKHVDAVLEGWEPKEVIIDKVDFFYGEGGDYITIIALLKVTPELQEANARLRLLPHIDTFGQYKPHVTLAYVKATSNWQNYVDDLNTRYAGKHVNALAINYGD